jgi:hypothetical protein
MIDINAHTLRLQRARDHIRAQLQAGKHVPSRDRRELEIIEQELAQLETKPRGQG